MTPLAKEQYDPDRELARAFRLGCGVLVVLFLVGWAIISLFWLN